MEVEVCKESVALIIVAVIVVVVGGIVVDIAVDEVTKVEAEIASVISVVEVVVDGGFS